MIGAAPEAPTCSRAGCSNAATATVNWRNPRIHSPERVKVWLACGEHSDYLREYLSARDFPVVVASLGTVVESVPTPAAEHSSVEHSSVEHSSVEHSSVAQ